MYNKKTAQTSSERMHSRVFEVPSTMCTGVVDTLGASMDKASAFLVNILEPKTIIVRIFR